MAALRNYGAQAPGASTPTSDKADGANVGQVEYQRNQGSSDCAADALAKRVAGAQARAALLGIEVHQIDGGAWLLCHARGAAIGTVQGLAALAAAVAGFEAARDDVAELVQRMRGAA